MEERTTLVAETALQRLMMEKALAMAQELERAGAAAPDGKVLDILEGIAVDRGRDFTRSALEGALQREVEHSITDHAGIAVEINERFLSQIETAQSVR